MSILSTNQKLIKVGQDYSAGENIGIYEHTISSRNWSPDITYAAESAFQRATGYTDTQISALSSDVSSKVSQLRSDIDYISGVALTAHQSLEGYLTKASGDEYYQPIGSYATVSQLESTSGEIVNLIPTDYVSNETLEQTSGNIVNLIPDTSEFITNVSAEQTYQHIGNYLSSNALEGYATEQWVENKGYITGVDLSNYYTKNETSGAEELENAFSQIGPGGDEEVNELVHSNSGEWNNVSAKLDSTAFSTVSGDFLTAIPDEYATKDFVSNSITGKLDISSFSSVSSDFLTNEDLNGYATESFVENVSGDITALIPTNYYPDNNPSGFITGVDLTPYQTIEGMTAYQPVGDYSTTTQVNELSGAIDYVSANAGDQEVNNIVHTNSATWDSVTNKLDTTAFSTVSGTFLTAVDLTPYQTTAGMTAYQPVGDYATTADLALKQDTITFGYDEQDRISAINNSAIAAGDELEVSHDNSLSGNGTVESPLSVVPGYNETVLWENSEGVQLRNGITLSESRLNFESIKIIYSISVYSGPAVLEIPMIGINRGSNFIQILSAAFDNHVSTTAGYCLFWQVFFSECTNTYLHSKNSQFIGKMNFINGSTPGTWTQGANDAVPIVYKVIGINRKA